MVNRPPRPTNQTGLTLMEVLVAIAIVAIAVFPMLQLVAESERSAFDAKFTSIACNQIRTLVSRLAADAPPGTDGSGDLSQFVDDEQGFEQRFAFEDIVYEWEVQALDLSADVAVRGQDDEEEDLFADEEEELLRSEEEDQEIDDRYRARYVRVTVRYLMEEGEERELVFETYLPPLPKKEPIGGASDAVPPNTGG